jgi:hypothetical protein
VSLDGCRAGGRLPAGGAEGRSAGPRAEPGNLHRWAAAVPAAPKISAQDEATILARHAAGEPLRAIAPAYGVSHQALSKRLKRARPPLPQQRKRQPQQPAAPAGGRAAVALAAVSP